MIQAAPWKAYQPTFPITNMNVPLDRIRENERALHLYNIINGGAISPGWSYTNSFVLSESAPGTAAAPARHYWYKGTGNEMQWIKQEVDYSAGATSTTSAFFYSNDNAYTYEPMLVDDDGNYVITVIYDGSGNKASSSWTNVLLPGLYTMESNVDYILLENGSDLILLEE